jgi:hypothetical protein
MGNYNSTNESQEEQNTSEGLFVDRLLKVVTGFYNDETLSKNEKFNKTVDSINDSIKLQHLQSQTQNSIDRFYQKFNIVETKIIIPSIIMNTIGLQEFTTEHYKIIYDSRRFHEIYNLIPDVTNTVLMKNGRQHLHNRFSSKQSYNSIQSINNYYIGDFIARGGNGVVYSILNYNDRYIKFVHGDNVEKAIDSYLETIIQLILYDECSSLSNFNFAKIGKIYNLFRFTINSHIYIAIVIQPFQTNVANYFYDISQQIKNNTKSSLELTTVNIFMMYQTIRTLNYLSKKLKFSHRDLKCDNIMIDFINFTNSNGIDCFQTYLIDFGNSRIEYNGFLFTSNYLFYFDDINKDFHNPLQDIGFLIFQTLWMDGCEQYALKNCVFLQETFYSYLLSLLFSLHPKIKKDYLTQEYHGVDNNNQQKWWKLYIDLLHAKIDQNHYYAPDYSAVISFIIFDLKLMLQEIAHHTNARGPFYFGKS